MEGETHRRERERGKEGEKGTCGGEEKELYVRILQAGKNIYIK